MRYYCLYISFLIPFVFLAQEKLQFFSKNPFSFKDIITNLNNQEDQIVYGILKMPDDWNENDICPLIIAVAGSNGWADHHYEYLDIYRTNGIATFELCSFKSRGIDSTIGSQIEVTTAMMIIDAYKAFEILADKPMIDRQKIGITGWSLGGGVALFSAWQPLKNSINSNVTFAAHLPLYPPCIVMPTILNFGSSPIHILIGELDNWTPANACLELANKIPNNNIELTIYPNSHHSFDRDSPVEIKKNGYILKDCRFRLKEDGSVLMNLLNIPMTTPLLQKIGVSMCAKRGPKYGGNKEAKAASLKFAKDFMIKHLNN
tara:strand:- start:856 stop:1806 length:951 start_codon:yes stop_codon:yes gene_type:complete